jgi:hypothetical protein
VFTPVSFFQLEIDPPINAPTSVIRTHRVDGTSRAGPELLRWDPQPLQVTADALRTASSETQIVFLGSSGVGPTDELHGLAVERTLRDALRHLIEDIAIFNEQPELIEVELRGVLSAGEL